MSFEGGTISINPRCLPKFVSNVCFFSSFPRHRVTAHARANVCAKDTLEIKLLLVVRREGGMNVSSSASRVTRSRKTRTKVARPMVRAFASIASYSCAAIVSARDVLPHTYRSQIACDRTVSVRSATSGDRQKHGRNTISYALLKFSLFYYILYLYNFEERGSVIFM